MLSGDGVNADGSSAIPAPDGVGAMPGPAGANEPSDDESDNEDSPDDDLACTDADSSENADGDASTQVNIVTCVERWRAAAPESRKKMFALFSVTGIFVGICRHGHPLAIGDMIRSGELCALSFSNRDIANGAILG